VESELEVMASEVALELEVGWVGAAQASVGHRRRSRRLKRLLRHKHRNRSYNYQETRLERGCNGRAL